MTKDGFLMFYVLVYSVQSPNFTLEKAYLVLSSPEIFTNIALILGQLWYLNAFYHNILFKSHNILRIFVGM